MKLVDAVIDSAASVSTRLPYFRGLGKVARSFNVAMLSLGASPLSYARMRDGSVLRIDLRSGTELYAKYLGTYDTRFVEVVKGIIDPSRDCLDVGANVGFYTVALATFLRGVAQGGQVFAFEPHEGNYRRLVENIVINQLGETAHAHQLGLSNSAGKAELTLREDFANGSSTGNAAIAINVQIDRDFPTVHIPLAKLDESRHLLRDGGRRIDFVKVDIEGHEDYFLEGAADTLNQARPVILMEINKPYYTARNVDLDLRFLPLLPNRYTIFRRPRSVWQRIQSLTECAEIDNVMLIPEERLTASRFATFVP